MPRRLTKELNGVISIDDGAGTRVHFAGDKEFNILYPLLDLTDKPKLTYELDRPDWAFHIDPARGINDTRSHPSLDDLSEMVVPEYEEVINAASTLLVSQQDPFRGLDLVAAKSLKKEQLKSEGKAVIDEKYDWTDLLPDPANPSTELTTDVQAVKSVFLIARHRVNKATTVNEVKIIVADWPLI